MSKTKLEKLMEEHVDKRAKEITTKQEDYWKGQLDEVLSVIKQSTITIEKEIAVLKKDNRFDYTLSMTEGGLLALDRLIDDLNEWTLERDQQIVIKRG